MSNNITTKFDEVFTLDSSKLSRLLSVVEDRFKAISPDFVSAYEISTRKGKIFSTGDISTILNHDNPINNPITTLSIAYHDQTEEPTNFVDIQFDKDDSRIRVKIQTDDPKVGNDIYAEVEEQLERTQNKTWVYSLKKQNTHELLIFFIFIITIPIMIFSFFAAFTDQNLKRTDYLSKEDVAFLSEQSKNSLTDTDKIDYLYEYHIRRIANSRSKGDLIAETFSKENIFNLKVVFLALPFLVVLIGVYYIISKTYLGSVFLWGDYLEYNKTITERRKFVWNAVVIAVIIGVISNLFVFGFSQYF